MEARQSERRDPYLSNDIYHLEEVHSGHKAAFLRDTNLDRPTSEWAGTQILKGIASSQSVLLM